MTAPPVQNGPNMAPVGITETILRPAATLAGSVAVGMVARTAIDVVLPGAVTTTAIVSGTVVATGFEIYRTVRDYRRGELVEPGFWRIARRLGGAAVRGAIVGGAVSFGIMGIEGIIGQEPLAAGLAGAIVGGGVGSVVSGLREANRVHNGGTPETRRQKTTRVLKAAGKGAAVGGVTSLLIGGGIGWAGGHIADGYHNLANSELLPWNGDGGDTGNSDGGAGGGNGELGDNDPTFQPSDESSPWAIKTGELGAFDTSEDPGVQPEINPETGFLGGTGSDAAARALQASYSHTHDGAELNWEELRQNPEFESAYYDFMGNVLHDNGMEWGDDTNMLPKDHLTISEGTLDKFLDDMDVNDTTGDSLTIADFAPGELGDVTNTSAFLSHVDDYVDAIAEHNPELASNPVHYGDYADGYLTYIHNQDPALYEAYANMHPAAQMQYMADLLARLAEESEELAGSDA